jgi:hypothetical protein
MRTAGLTTAFLVVASLAAIWSSSRSASADDAGKPPTITATITLPPRHSGGNDHPGPGSPDTTPPSICVATPSPASAALVDRYNSLHHREATGLGIIQVLYYSEQNSLRRYNVDRDRFERLVRISCTDPNDPQNNRLRWQVTAPPDPAFLLPGATRTATEQIGVPHPAISPTGDVAINLGMWLAVEQAGPYVARAEFSSAIWAETTATLATTTFDFGDGTPVVCDGIGTPIPADQIDSAAPGPCGRVYTDHEDVGPHTLTITATWRVTWRLSDGRTGQLADIVTTAQHDYSVYEVQTVGVSG